MYGDYRSIGWASGKSSFPALDTSSAHIIEPPFYKEIEYSENFSFLDKVPIGKTKKPFDEDTSDFIQGSEANESFSAGFSLHDDTKERNERESRESALSCIDKAKKVLTHDEKMKICYEKPTKPRVIHTVTSIYSQCATSTATKHVTPCSTQSFVTITKGCDCHYHVTYAC